MDMHRNYLLVYLFGILTHLVTDSVCREAIVGGHKANVHQFPYQVLLDIHDVDMCGGGIISDKFILTAAHCVVNVTGRIYNTKMSILAGTNDFNKTNKPAVKITVRKVCVPAGFTVRSPIRSVNDIAVLKLKRSLELSRNNHLMRLQLPKHKDENYTGRTALIAGFGHHWVNIDKNKQSVDSGYYDSQLRFAEVDILDFNDCRGDYHSFEISVKRLCARVKQLDDNETHGVCLGDSGSPLVVDGTTVVGVVSTALSACSEKTRAAIYTRVSHYLLFIENAMKGMETNDMHTSLTENDNHFQCTVH